MIDPTKPAEYITRPVPVEAWKLTLDNLHDVAKWCRGYVKGESIRFAKPKADRRPLDSTDQNHFAVVGDYVVRKAGGFTVIKAVVFERSHVPGRKRI